MALDLAAVPSFHSPQVQDPIEQLGKVLSLRDMIQRGQIQQQMAPLQIQSAQQENQMRQNDLNDQEIMRKAFVQSNGDLDKTMQLGMQGGASPKALQALAQHKITFEKSVADTDKVKLENNITRHDQLAGKIDAIEGAPEEQRQALWTSTLADAQKNKLLTPDELANVPQQYPGSPTAQTVKAGLLSYNAAAKTEVEKRNAASAETTAAAHKLTAETGEAKLRAELPGLQAKSDIEVANASMLKNMSDADWQKAIDATIPDPNSALYKRTVAAVKFARGRGNLAAAQTALKDAGDQLGRTETAIATAQGTAPIKINIAAATQAAGANAVTANGGLDLMAEQALNGQFTSRNPMLMAKVYGRASELASQRGMTAQQVLMERNAAHANAGAYTALTKQYEVLKPFADMAEKNANVLEQKAGKVSNLGASFWNSPLRSLESNFAGNTDVAAYKAALLPVQADFARILNSPDAKGVLSDSARGEMATAIKPGATPGEIKAALDVFRTDARNRRESYEANLADLKGRTVVGNTQATPITQPAAGGAAIAPAGKIAVISPEGTPGFIDADKWDAAQKRGFKKQ